MGRTIEARHWVDVEVAALHEEAAHARERGLPDAHGAERQVGGGHAIHPRLDHRRFEIADARRPAAAPTNEGQVLPEVPSVGSHSSFRLAALLALERAELLHQIDERLSHAPGPPARATATFSPGPSLRREPPAVKVGGGSRRWRVVVRDCSRELQLGGEAGTRSAGPKTFSGWHGGCLERVRQGPCRGSHSRWWGRRPGESGRRACLIRDRGSDERAGLGDQRPGGLRQDARPRIETRRESVHRRASW